MWSNRPFGPIASIVYQTNWPSGQVFEPVCDQYECVFSREAPRTGGGPFSFPSDHKQGFFEKKKIPTWNFRADIRETTNNQKQTVESQTSEGDIIIQRASAETNVVFSEGLWQTDKWSKRNFGALASAEAPFLAILT